MYEYLTGNKQWLLNQLDQKKVWSNILGYSFEIGQKILNPLRDDKHLGSCSICWSNKSDNLVLLDFADSRTNGFDCISAYQFLNPRKSWSEICSDLLTLGKSLPTSSYNVIPGLKPKESKEVEFIPIYRDWTDEDIKWWRKRGIVKEQLDRETTLVKPVNGYIQKKEGKESEIHFNEQCYCYHHLNKFKFYFPNRKNWRFIGNMGKNDIWLIRGNSNLIITKSHKDALALESCVPFSITHVQAETNFPESHILLDWELGFDNIWILYDNDKQGRIGAQLLSEQFIYKKPQIVFLEDYKDVSVMIYSEGLTETIDYLNTLIL